MFILQYVGSDKNALSSSGQCISNDNESYDLYTKAKHVIGRDSADLLLKKDSSVSRIHASISVSIENKKFKVTVQDLNSTFGTYVNDGIKSSTKINSNTSIELSPGDKIRFGKNHNIWKAEEIPLYVCSNGLSSTERNELNVILSLMNGMVISKWSTDCAYLTAKNFAINEKICSALASGKPVVTLEYWKRFSSLFSFNKEVPILNSCEYAPTPIKTLQGLNRNVFNDDLSRKHLFRGMTFFASSEMQYTNLFQIVTSAGGKIINASKNGLRITRSSTKQDVYLAPSEKEPFAVVFDAEIKGVTQNRLIHENEVLLSVILNSVDIFCNPRCDIESECSLHSNGADIKILKNNVQMYLGDDDEQEIQNSPNSAMSLIFPSTKRRYEDSSDDENDVFTKKFDEKSNFDPLKTSNYRQGSIETTRAPKFDEEENTINISRSAFNGNTSRTSISNEITVGTVNNNVVTKRNKRNKTNPLFNFSVNKKSNNDPITNTFVNEKRKFSTESSDEAEQFSKKLRINDKNGAMSDNCVSNKNGNIKELKLVSEKVQHQNMPGCSLKDTSGKESKVIQSSMSSWLRKPSKLSKVNEELSEIDNRDSAANNTEESSQTIDKSDFFEIKQQDLDTKKPGRMDMLSGVKIAVKPLVIDKENNPTILTRPKSIAEENENFKTFKKQNYVSYDESSLSFSENQNKITEDVPNSDDEIL